MKPGYKTSEFWTSNGAVVAILGVVLAVAQPVMAKYLELHPSAEWAALVVVALSALAGTGIFAAQRLARGYASDRAKLKGGDSGARGGSSLSVLLSLSLVLASLGAPARAEVPIRVGPTAPLSLLRMGPGGGRVEVLPGAGVQVSAAFLPRDVDGVRWHMLSLQLAFFGGMVSPAGGDALGAVSLAVGVCTASELLCVLWGYSLGTRPLTHPGFIGLSVSTAVLLGEPPATLGPPVRMANVLQF